VSFRRNNNYVSSERETGLALINENYVGQMTEANLAIAIIGVNPERVGVTTPDFGMRAVRSPGNISLSHNVQQYENEMKALS